MARIKDIDERKRGNNTNGSFVRETIKPSGRLIISLFFRRNQLPEAEWIFRLFPKAWPKINAAGSMLNVLSSINEAFPRLRLRSKYPNESTTTNSPPSKDSPPSNFTRLHPRPNKLNLPIVSISTICPPIFSLFLLLQIRRKNRSSRETTSERSAGVGLDDSIEKWLLVSIRLARYSILNLAAGTCSQKVAA